MDQEKERLNLAEVLNSLPKFHRSFSDEQEDTVSSRRQLDNVFKSILTDDKIQFIRNLKLLYRCHTSPLSESNRDATVPEAQCGIASLDRKTVANLLHFCCMFDSAECAAALLNGDAGVVPLVNETDARGRTALHTAADAHAPRCIELLLKKHARTDLRTRDGRRLLALDLALCSSRMDIVWNPDEHSIEDLAVRLGQKNLSALRLLSEKTEYVADVAFAQGIEGRVVPFAALLVVAEEKVKESIVVLHDADSGCKEKTTIYESLVREALALALGREDTTFIRAAKRTCNPTKAECLAKRKLLLCEIELLQLSGAMSPCGCIERKAASPLILATQAGDETVIQLLLKTDLEINDADAEGNSALHWCFKTSKISNQQQIKILHLLLNCGAWVSQKNKLGLTVVHLAAANGNVEALQFLVQEDPSSIYSKTETQETPLFFAVKNDRMECAALLLRHGANTEVLNLRRQRPIDMAKSQDMRYLLNSSNMILMNYAPSTPQRCIASSLEDASLPELRNVNLPDEGSRSIRRGTLNSIVHGEEELQQIQEGLITTAPALKRKIFVGGLPHMVDSDSLRRTFEEQFGPVEDAIVIGYQAERKVLSRGFGFVVFKSEESVSAALQLHHVTICGMQVEIKRAVQYPKSPFSLDFVETTPSDEPEPIDKTRDRAAASDEMKVEELEPSSEQMSWVDRVLRGQPKVRSDDSQPPNTTRSKDKSNPTWLRIFKKWLPGFLKDLSRKGSGEYYALSSLKSDFKAKCGVDLDHTSLGFTKLSEFMRSFPELCGLKMAPLASPGLPSNHMVLIPHLPVPHHQPLRPLRVTDTPSSANSADYNGLELLSQTESPVSCVTEDTNMQELTAGNSRGKHTSHDVSPRSLAFKPYELFGQRNTRVIHDETVNSEGITQLNLQKHLVLEALTRRNNSNSFFLRDIDFFTDYKGCVSKNCCFGCRQRKMLWANFPCQHLLWCSNCKLKAMKVAGNCQHKCVICDMEVQRIDPIPWTEGSQPSYRDLLSIMPYRAR